MNQPEPQPQPQQKPGEMPLIVEPPVAGNQAEMPTSAPSQEEKLQGIVAPTPQKKDQQSITINPEMPKVAEPSLAPSIPVINTDKDQAAAELIDGEIPSDQGLNPFNILSDKVADFTDPSEKKS